MTQAAKPAARPLSPHLQVYRLPLAAWLSITHRITGIGLTIGTVLLVYWIVSAAYGPDAYGAFTHFIGSPIGYLLLLGFSVALFYHLCNGIRHLFWDFGKGFELPQVHASGKAVFAATAVLTVLTWIVILAAR